MSVSLPVPSRAELRTLDPGRRETRELLGPGTRKRRPVPLPAVRKTDMTTITLITAANKGLGYETARRLIDLGHTVLAGARDPQRGTKAARVFGATPIHIDPTDDGSVEAAAARVRNEYGHLDVLIDNAGTAAPRLRAEELTADAAMEGFAINVFGPIRVTHAFLPLLRAAEHPRIANRSSGVGSFQRILEPGTVENVCARPPPAEGLGNRPIIGGAARARTPRDQVVRRGPCDHGPVLLSGQGLAPAGAGWGAFAPAGARFGEWC